jgi:opacity protein-like surface antigen
MKQAWMIAAIALLLPMQAEASDIKPYASMGLGLFELDPGKEKKTAFGGYVAVGAELHELLDAEVRLGATNANNATNKSKVEWMASALAKPKIKIARDIIIYGLAGVTALKTSYTPAGAAKRSKTNAAFTFGVGGSYELSDQAELGAEWVRYSSKADAATKNTSFGGLDVNGFVVNLNYRF